MFASPRVANPLTGRIPVATSQNLPRHHMCQTPLSFGSRLVASGVFRRNAEGASISEETDCPLSHKQLGLGGFHGFTRWLAENHWVVSRLGRRPFRKTIGCFSQKHWVVPPKPLGGNRLPSVGYSTTLYSTNRIRPLKLNSFPSEASTSF